MFELVFEFIKEHIYAIAVIAVIFYCLYLKFSILREILKNIIIGAFAGTACYCVLVSRAGKSSFAVPILMGIAMTGLLSFRSIRRYIKELKTYKQEEKQIQQNIEYLADILEKVGRNIEIMKASTLPFTGEELNDLEEAYRLYDETVEFFEAREEFEYIAAINFIQDVICSTYDAAEARWNEYVRRVAEEKGYEQQESGYKAEKINRTAQGKHSHFSGCSTKAELKKRYRELVKIYHPDAANGNTEMFEKIKDEYEELSKGMA